MIKIVNTSADDLEELNRNMVGKIEVISDSRGK